MDYKEFSSKIKTKYPQYSDIDDKTLAQKMVSKYPQYKDITFEDQKPDWKGVIQKGLSEATMRPGSFTRKLSSDPVSQAKALPYMTGTAGAMSGIPFGSTMGTAGGRTLSDLALTVYGRKDQIPSVPQQAGEIGLAALGDVAAIPFAHKAVRGAQIGEAEAAASVPNVIQSLERPGGPGPTGKWIGETYKSIQNGELAEDPIIAKQIKDQAKFIYKNNKQVPLTDNDTRALSEINRWAQGALNKSVPGRALPASKMATAMKVPNAISRIYQKVPKLGRIAGGSIVLEEALRRLYGR